MRIDACMADSHISEIRRKGQGGGGEVAERYEEKAEEPLVCGATQRGEIAGEETKCRGG